MESESQMIETAQERRHAMQQHQNDASNQPYAKIVEKGGLYENSRGEQQSKRGQSCQHSNHQGGITASQQASSILTTMPTSQVIPIQNRPYKCQINSLTSPIPPIAAASRTPQTKLLSNPNQHVLMGQTGVSQFSKQAGLSKIERGGEHMLGRSYMSLREQPQSYESYSKPIGNAFQPQVQVSSQQHHYHQSPLINDSTAFTSNANQFRANYTPQNANQTKQVQSRSKIRIHNTNSNQTQPQNFITSDTQTQKQHKYLNPSKSVQQLRSNQSKTNISASLNRNENLRAQNQVTRNVQLQQSHFLDEKLLANSHTKLQNQDIYRKISQSQVRLNQTNGSTVDQNMLQVDLQDLMDDHRMKSDDQVEPQQSSYTSERQLFDRSPMKSLLTVALFEARLAQDTSSFLKSMSVYCRVTLKALKIPLNISNENVADSDRLDKISKPQLKGSTSQTETANYFPKILHSWSKQTQIQTGCMPKFNESYIFELSEDFKSIKREESVSMAYLVEICVYESNILVRDSCIGQAFLQFEGTNTEQGTVSQWLALKSPDKDKQGEVVGKISISITKESVLCGEDGVSSRSGSQMESQEQLVDEQEKLGLEEEEHCRHMVRKSQECVAVSSADSHSEQQLQVQQDQSADSDHIDSDQEALDSPIDDVQLNHMHMQYQQHIQTAQNTNTHQSHSHNQLNPLHMQTNHHHQTTTNQPDSMQYVSVSNLEAIAKTESTEQQNTVQQQMANCESELVGVDQVQVQVQVEADKQQESMCSGAQREGQSDWEGLHHKHTHLMLEQESSTFTHSEQSSRMDSEEIEQSDQQFEGKGERWRVQQNEQHTLGHGLNWNRHDQSGSHPQLMHQVAAKQSDNYQERLRQGQQADLLRDNTAHNQTDQMMMMIEQLPNQTNTGHNVQRNNFANPLFVQQVESSQLQQIEAVQQLSTEELVQLQREMVEENARLRSEVTRIELMFNKIQQKSETNYKERIKLKQTRTKVRQKQQELSRREQQLLQREQTHEKEQIRANKLRQRQKRHEVEKVSMLSQIGQAVAQSDLFKKLRYEASVSQQSNQFAFADNRQISEEDWQFSLQANQFVCHFEQMLTLLTQLGQDNARPVSNYSANQTSSTHQMFTQNNLDQHPSIPLPQWNQQVNQTTHLPTDQPAVERLEKDLSENRSHSSFLTTSIAANSANVPIVMGTHLKNSGLVREKTQINQVQASQFVEDFTQKGPQMVVNEQEQNVSSNQVYQTHSSIREIYGQGQNILSGAQKLQKPFDDNETQQKLTASLLDQNRGQINNEGEASVSEQKSSTNTNLRMAGQQLKQALRQQIRQGEEKQELKEEGIRENLLLVDVHKNLVEFPHLTEEELCDQMRSCGKGGDFSEIKASGQDNAIREDCEQDLQRFHTDVNLDEQEGEKDKRARLLYENHLDTNLSSANRLQDNLLQSQQHLNAQPQINAHTPTQRLSYEQNQALIKASQLNYQQETISSVLPPNSLIQPQQMTNVTNEAPTNLNQSDPSLQVFDNSLENLPQLQNEQLFLHQIGQKVDISAQEDAYQQLIGKVANELSDIQKIKADLLASMNQQSTQPVTNQQNQDKVITQKPLHQFQETDQVSGSQINEEQQQANQTENQMKLDEQRELNKTLPDESDDQQLLGKEIQQNVRKVEGNTEFEEAGVEGYIWESMQRNAERMQNIGTQMGIQDPKRLEQELLKNFQTQPLDQEQQIPEAQYQIIQNDYDQLDIQNQQDNNTCQVQLDLLQSEQQKIKEESSRRAESEFEFKFDPDFLAKINQNMAQNEGKVRQKQEQSSPNNIFQEEIKENFEDKKLELLQNFSELTTNNNKLTNKNMQSKRPFIEMIQQITGGQTRQNQLQQNDEIEYEHIDNNLIVTSEAPLSPPSRQQQVYNQEYEQKVDMYMGQNCKEEVTSLSSQQAASVNGASNEHITVNLTPTTTNSRQLQLNLAPIIKTNQQVGCSVDSPIKNLQETPNSIIKVNQQITPSPNQKRLNDVQQDQTNVQQYIEGIVGMESSSAIKVTSIAQLEGFANNKLDSLKNEDIDSKEDNQKSSQLIIARDDKNSNFCDQMTPNDFEISQRSSNVRQALNNGVPATKSEFGTDDEISRLINESYQVETEQKEQSLIYKGDQIYDQPKKALYGIQPIKKEQKQNLNQQTIQKQKDSNTNHKS